MAAGESSEQPPPESLDAEDPLFVLFPSGTTGIPKGVVHSHGGYLLCTAITTRLVFDLKDDEIFWCTADIGWVTGHSYSVYGPLLNGLTRIMYEGSAGNPDFGRFGEIIQTYRVNKFYATPQDKWFGRIYPDPIFFILR